MNLREYQAFVDCLQDIARSSEKQTLLQVPSIFRLVLAFWLISFVFVCLVPRFSLQLSSYAGIFRAFGVNL